MTYQRNTCHIHIRLCFVRFKRWRIKNKKGIKKWAIKKILIFSQNFQFPGGKVEEQKKNFVEKKKKEEDENIV